MDNKIINNIKALGIDMINEAKSGHPGIVLGAAPIMYTLYAHHLNFDPTNPKYFNRDRFVMSAGHASLHFPHFSQCDISTGALSHSRSLMISNKKTNGIPHAVCHWFLNLFLMCSHRLTNSTFSGIIISENTVHRRVKWQNTKKRRR